MQKSLVVGIHDGLNLLHYSLRNLPNLPVDEIIFVLDRCNPLPQYIDRIKMHVPNAQVIVKTEKTAQYGPSETFRTGLDKATGELLYVSAEDIILDPTNFSEEYWRDPNVGFVDFRYYQHDPYRFNFHVCWDTMLLTLSDKLFNYGTTRSGLYGIPRNVYDEAGGIVDSPTEEDWLRKTVVSLGYKHLHIKSTRNIHLRPSYDRQRQLLQGASRRKQGYSLSRAVAHSILHFKPYVLKGYLQDDVS